MHTKSKAQWYKHTKSQKECTHATMPVYTVTLPEKKTHQKHIPWYLFLFFKAAQKPIWRPDLQIQVKMLQTQWWGNRTSNTTQGWSEVAVELARSWLFTVPTTALSHLRMNKPERCTMTNEIPVTKSTNKGANKSALGLVLFYICNEDVLWWVYAPCI